MENKTVDNKDNIDDNTDNLEVECPICFEIFDYDDKSPRKLTCCMCKNKNICLDCLIKIFNKDGICSFCKQKFTERPINLKKDIRILKKLKTGKELECLYCQNKEDFINFFYYEDEKKNKM